MARRAFISRTGGPEAIEWEDVALPPPGDGEIRMKNEAIGLNYIDTYHRSGVYPVDFPAGLGLEAAGVVTVVGPGVFSINEGDRVATFGPARGAYATERNLPAASVFKLPDSISSETAAGALLKGCTAEFLAERAATIKSGDAVLVHAAAGGVGLILVQWLKTLGAHVIGTVGSPNKATLARDAGVDDIILYREEDTATRARELTGGEGVRVTYDGVGAATWDASLRATGRRGLIVSYGNASGPVANTDLGVLARHGSLFTTRPTLFDYYATPEERQAGADRLWRMLHSGKVKVTIGQRYPLADAARAHADLERRATAGSTLLIPEPSATAPHGAPGGPISVEVGPSR